jgi:3'-phosphoadenosine 5'-phosphosulfate sulfotransferase (PAPS reductase)/FAD synthetase
VENLAAFPAEKTRGLGVSDMNNRIVSWFSCGAASAVATKLAIEKNKREFKVPLVVANCFIEEEHPDNKRFLVDCQEWFGQEIIQLKHDKYDGSIYKVFEGVKYLKGNAGAPCTRLLKKQVREDFQAPNDRQILGYTVEEFSRIDGFIDANNDVDFWPILQEQQMSKQDCFAVLAKAGIELPEMYKLGYKNNNCIGCVKGGAGYWNKIRKDFPETFERMAATEERIGATILYKDVKKEASKSGKNEKTLIPLRELPEDMGNYNAELDISCGIFCQMATQDIG